MHPLNLTNSDSRSQLWPKLPLRLIGYAALFLLAYLISDIIAHSFIRAKLGFPAAIATILVGMVVLLEIHSRYILPSLYKLLSPKAATPLIGRRVDGQMYVDLADGHRTTFVTGMCDMLNFSSLYFDQKYKHRVDRMFQYQEKFKGDELRTMFDEYMARDSVVLKVAAANCYFNALYEWSAKKN
jgi:hypothetical protein